LNIKFLDNVLFGDADRIKNSSAGDDAISVGNNIQNTMQKINNKLNDIENANNNQNSIQNVIQKINDKLNEIENTNNNKNTNDRKSKNEFYKIPKPLFV
jgi:peptidoglycan hydrolase CwlO-like protein